MNKIVGTIIQKLTTTKFASSIIILLLNHLAERTETKVDDALVELVRKALEEEPRAHKA